MGDLLHPEAAIEAFGYIGLFLIVFAESGLLVGFFLPGDSLLFTAGLFASRPIPGTDEQLNIVAVIVICVVAAIIGDQFGYLFGRRVGPSIFRKPNSKIFKQAYVEKSQEFFEAHGPKTIVLARFVPIVRTFAPVLAGVGRMHYRTFVTYNIGGGLLWGVGVPLIGYFLGQVEFVRDNLEVMIIIIVGISVLPVAFEVLRGRINARRAPVAERLARLEDAVSDDDEVDAAK
ncbi:MAG TPA: VTT domain-containing protein [Mycobacteriales bacterium]|jgi:membrane-associated protein|nr:VTT domain-containing protein [Mycobacteriales bacterium]